MAVSLYDQCTTTDWENIALRISQLAAALSLLLSIIALGLGFTGWTSFYTLAVGLLLSIWECPVIYICVPSGRPFFCKEMEAQAVQIFLNNTIVKAILYFGLSIGTFFNLTICALAGFVLLIAGCLNAMAAISYKLNQRDGLHGETGDDASIDDRGPSTMKFGTF